MTGLSRAAAARRMALCCRQLAAGGLIAGQDGNLSVRFAPDRILVTPSGRLKALLTPRDMVEVDLAGRGRARGGGRARKATSELDLHLRILRHRPDVNAVVHAHPPTATGFAVAGEEIPPNVLPELIFVVGPVPVVPFGMPGTPELGERLLPNLAGHDALLLANHGAVTMGKTLDAAWIRMESLEHAARIVVAARAAAPGGPRPLDPAVVQRLEALRERNG
ncbi:MAG: class II aldolase/adducin family protein [Gemmatimonadales bacterium]